MRILLLAGEESGLIYRRGLVERFRARLTEVEIRGYADYGFAVSDLAVMGFAAVLFRIGYFLRVKRTMERAIDEWRPEVVVTIDYPGLNLALARYAKRRGIRTVHVVCPQVWAWKKGRIPKIESSLDRLCCFFPFEPKLFTPAFAVFVGHPLAWEFAELKRQPGAGRTVALLPGSRHGEIARILPTLIKAAARLEDARFVIPAATGAAKRQIESIIDRSAIRPKDLTVRLKGARELLLSADAAVVASGTATLEAAFARCPTILVYRLSPPLMWFARHFVRGTRFAGLINIVWDRCRPDFDENELRSVRAGSIATAAAGAPMPELIQEAMTPEAIVSLLRGFLDDPAMRALACERLSAATKLLSSDGDPLSRVAAIVLGA